MNATEYIQHNKKELIILVILLLTKSVVQLFAFPNSFWLVAIRVVLFVIACILALIIIDKWKFKLLTVALIILFSMIQGQLKLWRLPAIIYINKLNTEYSMPIDYVLSDDSIRSIDYNPQRGLTILKGFNYKVDSMSLSDADKELISAFLTETEVFEIEKNKHGTLFIMDRFIDNGYGLLYSSPENIGAIINTDHYRINVYDVTGCTKIWGNWYYISFT